MNLDPFSLYNPEYRPYNFITIEELFDYKFLNYNLTNYDYYYSFVRNFDKLLLEYKKNQKKLFLYKDKLSQVSYIIEIKDLNQLILQQSKQLEVIYKYIISFYLKLYNNDYRIYNNYICKGLYDNNLKIWTWYIKYGQK